MNWATIATVRTDFNTIREDGSYRVLRIRVAGIVPQVGDMVMLEDAEGNSCLGVVLAVDPKSIQVMPEWTTWQPNAQPDYIVEFTAPERSANPTSEVGAKITEGQDLAYLAA